MTRDDILHMAREASNTPHDYWHATPDLVGVNQIERFAALVTAHEREKVAQWMIARSYATGHGDTIEDLLKELEWQIDERIAAERNRLWTQEHWTEYERAIVAAEREECARVVWPTEQVKVWSDEELTAMTGAFNRAQEKHGWYETIMAVGAAALKGRAAAIRARGQQ